MNECMWREPEWVSMYEWGSCVEVGQQSEPCNSCHLQRLHIPLCWFTSQTVPGGSVYSCLLRNTSNTYCTPGTFPSSVAKWQLHNPGSLPNRIASRVLISYRVLHHEHRSLVFQLRNTEQINSSLSCRRGSYRKWYIIKRNVFWQTHYILYWEKCILTTHFMLSILVHRNLEMTTYTLLLFEQWC